MTRHWLIINDDDEPYGELCDCAVGIDHGGLTPSENQLGVNDAGATYNSAARRRCAYCENAAVTGLRHHLGWPVCTDHETTRPFRHMVEAVQAWRCGDCSELFYPDWPPDEVPCPAHTASTKEHPMTTDTFTFTCQCHATVNVHGGVEQPHDCPLTEAERQRIRGAAAEAFDGT